ncbi:hypothetical protein [Tahibacter aquaticus]|uniref:hypothetical protein n=1 Tax=Tahibacter aquaticus TaxID=520092 RepID=UPI0010615FE6|nr:hypothetical protein [Tahibacter aquaticus]
MPFRYRRHRRWIALFALIGLLFQQFAMAAYVCPQEIATATAQVVAEMPPCHTPDTSDQARCHEHCHPTTASADHAPALTVPPAFLPATTWSRELACTAALDQASPEYPLRVRAQPPPLSIQHCTFQI